MTVDLTDAMIDVEQAAVIAVNPDQVPIARPRSSSLNEELINARLPGTSKAPPTP